MYLIFVLPFVLLSSVFALIPEQCQMQEAVAVAKKNNNTKSMPIKKVLDFKKKASINKATKQHQKSIYKILRKKGVSKKIASYVFKLKFLQKPISSAKSQPELLMTIDVYQSKFWKHKIVAKNFYEKYQENLKEAEIKYNVDKEIITALITMESLAGRRKGNINILNALFTLSYASPRSEFFKSELVYAFKLLESKKHNFKTNTRGSWAGAMGYSQFIPSSVWHYAVDGSGDGKIDIINNPIDAIHSAANYLNKAKWQKGGVVTKELTVEDLKNLYVCSAINKEYDGGKLILPEAKPKERFFVVYNNYNSLIRWNRSFLFAYTAEQIADNLKR